MEVKIAGIAALKAIFSSHGTASNLKECIAISLSKQFHIYSVDTSAFYTDREMKLNRRLNKNFFYKKRLTTMKENCQDPVRIDRIDIGLHSIKKRIKKMKTDILIEFEKHSSVRALRSESLGSKQVISVFDSVLSRVLQLEADQLTDDIMVVQTYYLDVLEQLIMRGFMHNDEPYICLTASAGQIRTKKTVFIKEKLWHLHKATLMCGLSEERINASGGVNVNKYLAYLALCNSATDHWESFPIDKAIVVHDMESAVRSIVDFIDDGTYEITRKEMDMMINHTDGCGMILPRKSKKSMMIRLPWIKGLLVPFPFDAFIREAKRKNRACGKVKDIYGDEHDILADGIEIILTKSQFKMWMYYQDWRDYKQNFTHYQCQAATCNEEEDYIGDAKLNYQMLQTLTDLTDQELVQLAQPTLTHLHNLGKDRDTMLRVLGVTKSNRNKNDFQQALELYPELLADAYSKKIIKDVKKSLVHEARAGKLEVDGKYTFICPDLYAFCERLFLGIEQPAGLIDNGEVYCSLYPNDTKLDCLRSPHLYREHAVRLNKIDAEKRKWFITKGLYTSCRDPISKILMFDNDGDKALVCVDPTLVAAAERHMDEIVPLQYNMSKAEPEPLDYTHIYNGLKVAYTGGNIGMISNYITKLWNSSKVNLEIIKWLCMENNFTIDYAKTLYKPTRPPHISKQMKDAIPAKVPYFFIYAKGKEPKDVDKKNNSIVNRLEALIKNPTLQFRSSNIGKFDYTFLLSARHQQAPADEAIIEAYTALDQKSHFMLSREDEKNSNIRYMYAQIKNEILQIHPDAAYVVDVLVEYLYNHKKSSYKTTLWECFGDRIVANIKHHLSLTPAIGSAQCANCGARFPAVSKRKKYCDPCLIEVNRNQTRERVRKHRHGVTE